MRRVLAFGLIALLGAAAHAQQVDPLRADADAYAAYVSAPIDAEIGSTEAMDAALARVVRCDAAQLARGRIAHAALAAARSPAFAAGVQSRVRAAGGAAVLRQLRRDPTYARRRPPGASEAIGLARASMAADAARLLAAGARYDALGHAVSSAAWNTPIDSAHRDARDVQLRALTNQSPSPAESARSRRGRATVMDRILTLAALAILEAAPERLDAALDDPPTRACLALQQLELRQCVSVSHTPDEDAFCLARHGPSGVGECFGAAPP